MSIGHLTLNALWRRTISTTVPADPSPWVIVPGFDKSRRLFDILRLIHLGTLRDIIPSALLDGMADGTLKAFYGMQGCSADQVLYRMRQRAHMWSKDRNLDLGVGTLNLRRLGRSRNNWPYPELDSRIKAARCRVPFAFVAWLMVRLSSYPLPPEQALNAKVRAICCWALDVTKGSPLGDTLSLTCEASVGESGSNS